MASVLVLILVSLQLVAAFEPVKIPLNVITHSDSSDPKDCSLGEEITANIDNIRNVVSDILQDIHLNPKCGDGLWHRVAFLNMSDPTHQCPSAWSEYNSDGIRTCRRPTSTSGSCPGVVYNISHQYSRVCGRVIGYQFGSPNAFSRSTAGINIARGMSLIHVWSYIDGANEQGACTYPRCPCSEGPDPPSYIGNNYYCESAYPGPDCYVSNMFFPNDTLWDGQQCNNEGTCCTGDGTNTPPWFSVELSDLTSDDIQVTICHDQDTSDEDTLIQLLEVFVK